jgi:hypothetical protein
MSLMQLRNHGFSAVIHTVHKSSSRNARALRVVRVSSRRQQFIPAGHRLEVRSWHLPASNVRC